MTAVGRGGRRDRYAPCGAKKRQGEGHCQRPAGWGTKHPGTGRCKLHGGSTPGQVAKAFEDEARAAVVTYGRPIETTGVDALLDELRWTFGHVVWLRGMVQQVEPDALVWGVSKRKSEGVAALEVANNEEGGVDLDLVPAVGVERTEAAAVNVWVKLYQEERRHLVDVAERCVRVGIDERKVRMVEQQGQLLVGGLQWLFAKLQLSDRKAELANRLVLEMLRSLNAGQIPVIEGKAS
jgi:hypothetical protein